MGDAMIPPVGEANVTPRGDEKITPQIPRVGDRHSSRDVVD
jgi:hypothetical protein